MVNKYIDFYNKLIYYNRMKKINYLNNKELLSEIHKSKRSFCSFLKDEYYNYDFIVDNINDINDELVERVRLKKSTPRGQPAIPLENIPPESIVFRVMTYEHIPLDTTGKMRKSKTSEHTYSRTTFHPFKHYILKDGALEEVCRSHWVGSISNGYFSAEHGKISNRLAMMFMMLTDKYSNRGNWRGYSYVDEMRAHALLHLSQTGLQFNESKSDNPFAFYTTIITNCFKRVANDEKKSQMIRDDLISMSGATPSYGRQVEHDDHAKDYYNTSPRGSNGS